MKSNGKEIYNAKVSKVMWNKQIDDSIADMVTAKKEKWKIEHKNSKQYLTEQEARDIAQMFSVTKKEVIDGLKIASKQLAESILEFIKNELGLFNKGLKKTNYCHEEIEEKRIKEIIHICLPALKKLKGISSHNLIRETKGNSYTDYENLFSDLIELDARFAMFAPLNSIKRPTNENRIEILPERYKKIVEIEKKNMENDSNADYVSRNLKFKSDLNDERENEINRFINELEESKFKARFEMVQATESLNERIYQFVIKKLDLHDFDEPTLKCVDIKNVLTMCKSATDALKLSCEDNKLNSIAGWDEFDPYTELFNNLINLNIKFAFFAPKKSLRRLCVNFNKLSEKEKDVMFDLLKQHGLWDDEEFYNNYRHVFGVQLANNTKNEI